MRKNSTPRKILITVNILLLLGLAGSTGYLFLDNRDLNDQINLTTEQKNLRLIEEINEVFSLPDEEPVVAIVTDVEEFKKTYATFENAESGDYLLFFRKARLNVLYRQDEKRVVKTADVIVPIAVELVGSEEAIAKAEVDLAEFGNQISITKTVTPGVTQSFVFDVDDDQSEETTSIAEQLGHEIGSTLPSTIELLDQTEVVVVVADNSEPETPSTP